MRKLNAAAPADAKPKIAQGSADQCKASDTLSWLDSAGVLREVHRCQCILVAPHPQCDHRAMHPALGMWVFQ